MSQTIAPIPSLTRWGLSADADMIFRTLTLCGPHEVATIVSELGISRPRAHRALSDLYDAGVARIATSTGKQVWIAAAVGSALERLCKLRARRRPPPPSRQLSIEDIAQRSVNLGPGLRYLASRELARQRLSVVTVAARHESLAINPEPVFDVASLQAAGPMERVLQDRGVHARVLGVQLADPTLLSPFVENSIPMLVYRQMPSLPMKLVVVDRKTAFFPVDPSQFERGYLEIDQQTIVESLVAVFERHWDAAAEPLERLMMDFTVSPREEAVIALLVYGCTDASTANRLGISERSVSNIVRSLMDRLGVDNRFQLGVALGAIRAAPLPPGMLQFPQERRPGSEPVSEV